MVRKGHGKVKGRSLQGHAGCCKPISKVIHSSYRLWSDLPATVMVCILASLPGQHRRSRITLAHMTLCELWKELKKVLELKTSQFLPARNTQQVILDAMIQSYTLQRIAVPAVQLSVRVFDDSDWPKSAKCFWLGLLQLTQIVMEVISVYVGQFAPISAGCG